MLEADFGKGKIGFKDGGIRENNPSYAAYSEHASVKGDDHEPALLLSIGTGRPDVTNDGFAELWPGPLGKIPLLRKWSEKLAVFKNLLIKYTEGEDRHKMMRAIAKGEHRWYKRLNVEGLHNMKLDNWEKGEWTNPQTGVKKEVAGGRTLSRMETATHAYLDRDEADKKVLEEYAPPKIVLRQVAERLVRHRRAREASKHEDLRRWETHMGQYLTGVRVEQEDSMVKRPEEEHRRGSKVAAALKSTLSKGQTSPKVDLAASQSSMASPKNSQMAKQNEQIGSLDEQMPPLDQLRTASQTPPEIRVIEESPTTSKSSGKSSHQATGSV